MKNQYSISKLFRFLFFVALMMHVLNFKAQCTLTASFTYTNGPNGQVYFTSTSIGTNSNTIYRWNFMDYYIPLGIHNSTSASSYTKTFTNNATYKIYHGVINTQPTYCADSVFQLITVTNASCSAVTAFSLQPMPNQNFTWNGLVTYPSNVAGVTWYWGDGTTSNNLYPTHTYSAAGFYNVCFSVTLTCGGVYSTCTYSYLNKSSQNEANQVITLNIIQGPPTSISEQTANLNDVSIFPNPNNSSFYFNLNGIGSNKEVKISVYTILGKEVYSDNYITSIDHDVKKVELVEVPSGSYFVKIRCEDKVKVTKLLVVR